MDNHDTLTEDDIVERLATSSSEFKTIENRFGTFFPKPHRPAAVLIPMIKFEDQNWHILFTRRTDEVADHKGQVAFPGGRKENEDETAMETALREAHEEIGLHQGDVRILGEFEGIYTITNYLVTPVVGSIKWPFPIKLEKREVNRVFTIPLKWLSKKENFQIRQRTVTFPNHVIPQTLDVVYYEPYDGEVLWGVSAEITLRLLHRLLLV